MFRHNDYRGAAFVSGRLIPGYTRAEWTIIGLGRRWTEDVWNAGPRRWWRRREIGDSDKNNDSLSINQWLLITSALAVLYSRDVSVKLGVQFCMRTRKETV